MFLVDLLSQMHMIEVTWNGKIRRGQILAALLRGAEMTDLTNFEVSSAFFLWYDKFCCIR